jgi:hypothetical protein
MLISNFLKEQPFIGSQFLTLELQLLLVSVSLLPAVRSTQCIKTFNLEDTMQKKILKKYNAETNLYTTELVEVHMSYIIVFALPLCKYWKKYIEN